MAAAVWASLSFGSRAEMSEISYPPTPDILLKLIKGAQKAGKPLASEKITEGGLEYSYHLRTAVYIGSWEEPVPGQDEVGDLFDSTPSDDDSGEESEEDPGEGDGEEEAQEEPEEETGNAVHVAQFLYIKSSPKGQSGLIPAQGTAFVVFFDSSYEPVTYWTLNALGPFTIEGTELKYDGESVMDINALPLVGNILVGGMPMPIPKL